MSPKVQHRLEAAFRSEDIVLTYDLCAAAVSRSFRDSEMGGKSARRLRSWRLHHAFFSIAIHPRADRAFVELNRPVLVLDTPTVTEDLLRARANSTTKL